MRIQEVIIGKRDRIAEVDVKTITETCLGNKVSLELCFAKPCIVSTIVDEFSSYGNLYWLTLYKAKVGTEELFFVLPDHRGYLNYREMMRDLLYHTPSGDLIKVSLPSR